MPFVLLHDAFWQHFPLRSQPHQVGARYFACRTTSSNAHVSEENFARYCLGGCHPVRIGDRFNNGKYEVVSKLGYGLYSTVWLVRDSQ